MAYRRRQTSKDVTDNNTAAAAPASSLAAQAIKASAAHRDSSSLSSAYSSSASFQSDRSKGSATYDYTSMGSTNQPGGFWGVLARKAKSILDDDESPRSSNSPGSMKTETVSTSNQVEHHYESFENSRKMDNPKLRKGLDRLATSLNQIGGSIGNAFEEGRTMVDKKTQGIIQETRKLQSRRKGMTDEEYPFTGWQEQLQEPRRVSKQEQTNQENQIKASRDVRWQLQQLLRRNYSCGS